MASSTACEMHSMALSSFTVRDRGCAARLRRHVPASAAGPSRARSAVRATSVDRPMNDVKPGLERAKMEARRREQVELKELEKPLCKPLPSPWTRQEPFLVHSSQRIGHVMPWFRPRKDGRSRSVSHSIDRTGQDRTWQDVPSETAPLRIWHALVQGVAAVTTAEGV